MEEWKQINGYPDYAVNDQGQVKSLRWDRLLKLNQNSSNYLYVNLVKDKRKKTTAVHRLVIEHFGPPKPFEGWVVDHKDGDKQNNTIGNLEWTSISENTRRAHGNHDKRVKTLELRQQGLTLQQIATQIGMSMGFVQDVIHSNKKIE